MLALSKCLAIMLKQKVADNGWDTRVKSQWKTIVETDLSDFPQSTECELRDKTSGCTSLCKLTPVRKSTHPSDTGQYQIMVHKVVAGILKAKIQSKHTSAGSYNLCIEYGPIWGSFCKCKSGSRIVGCCALNASVM